VQTPHSVWNPSWLTCSQEVINFFLRSLCIEQFILLGRGSLIELESVCRYARSMEDDKVRRTQQGCLHSLGCVRAVFLVCFGAACAAQMHANPQQPQTLSLILVKQRRKFWLECVCTINATNHRTQHMQDFTCSKAAHLRASKIFLCE
jgi:hypothetical protein